MTAASLRAEVQTFLEALACGFTSGNGAAVAKLWEAPALVIGPDGVMPVANVSEVEAFFGGAHRQYNAQGIVDTRPEIQHLEQLGDRIVVVKVRWPYVDKAGRTVDAEASDYTLRRDDAGALKVRAVLMRGVE